MGLVILIRLVILINISLFIS